MIILLKNNIIRFILNYAEPIGLTEVANNLGISANYLSNIFSKVAGVTFIKYLTNIRMEMAIMYLKTKPHMKMSEVAHAVGYPSDKYFLNVFHKYYGVTPSKFRSS